MLKRQQRITAVKGNKMIMKNKNYQSHILERKYLINYFYNCFVRTKSKTLYNKPYTIHLEIILKFSLNTPENIS